MVLLHGFAGSGASWDAVRAAAGGEAYPALAPDLHGPDFDATVAQVLAVAPAEFGLAGYSMGGRIALHVALAAPQRIRRLILVAATAGIEDPDERATRLAADEALAQGLERDGIAAFATTWTTQPLFANDPPAVRAHQAAEVLAHDASTLAATLGAFSPGRIPAVWDRLAELTMPVDVLAGARDEKYVELARRLAAALPHAQLHLVPGAGHGLLREAPQAVADLLSVSRAS